MDFIYFLAPKNDFKMYPGYFMTVLERFISTRCTQGVCVMRFTLHMALAANMATSFGLIVNTSAN